MFYKILIFRSQEMDFPLLHVTLGLLNVIKKISPLLGNANYVFALSFFFYISNDVSEGVAIFANAVVITMAMHTELFIIVT